MQEANPTSNYGTATSLLVNGASNPDVESYLRFTVSGVTGPIQSARLRVYVTTNGTNNGPAVYAAGNSWTETGITWNTRPALVSGAADNKGALGTNAWVEYDVTALVTGDGTYTFALLADSADGVTFSSRQGSTSPQLVLTLSTGGAPN